jgi:2-hydroxy-3-keto-5-methylthiopentenyl-1-phosphate phosphatase
VVLMDRHPTAQKIMIGDSVTDLNMAIAVDVVFAWLTDKSLCPRVEMLEI